MKEIWKIVPDLPDYRVSNLGRLRRGDRLCSLSRDRSGAVVIAVEKNGYTTTLRIARLVGAAFCKNFRPELRAVYRNGNREDCRPRNLKWVRQSEVTGAPYSKNRKNATRT